MEHSLVNHFEYSKEAGKISQYSGYTMGLDGSEYESHQRQEICLSSKTSRPALETMQLLSGYQGSFHRGKVARV